MSASAAAECAPQSAHGTTRVLDAAAEEDGPFASEADQHDARATRVYNQQQLDAAHDASPNDASASPIDIYEETHVLAHRHQHKSDIMPPRSLPLPMHTPASTDTPAAVPAPKLLDAGLAAMKQNLIPGLILQAIAASIIIVYFVSPQAQVSFKNSVGIVFAAVSTGLCGGFIPVCIIGLKKECE
jgi:hypothetical protein